MSYQKFEERMLKARRVNPDGIFGFQCADLVKQYLIDEHGIPNGAYGHARQYWESTAFNILAKFAKKETKSVLAGDIVVLKPTSDQPRHQNGHLGIATGVQSASTVEILEQNGSSGTGDGEGNNRIRKRHVPKSRMFGVLRPKPIGPQAARHPYQYLVGKTIKLSPKNRSWRVYKPGNAQVLGDLFKIAGADGVYVVRGVDVNKHNRVLINSAKFGAGVSLPLANAAGKEYTGEWKII
jgi:hypothetical protein